MFVGGRASQIREVTLALAFLLVSIPVRLFRGLRHDLHLLMQHDARERIELGRSSTALGATIVRIPAALEGAESP